MSDLISRSELLKDIKDWQEDIRYNEKDAIKHDFVFDRIYEIVKQGGVTDMCEWKLNGVYLISPHPLVSLSCITNYGYRYNYCPVCGKKIKAVE